MSTISDSNENLYDANVCQFFEKDGLVDIQQVIDFCANQGILRDDPRLKTMLEESFELLNESSSETLKQSQNFKKSGLLQSLNKNSNLPIHKFKQAIKKNVLFMDKIIQKDFKIQDFNNFQEKLQSIFEEVKQINEGKVADYIPELGNVDPDLFGVSFCSIEGQRCQMGDYSKHFCIQSINNVIIYALAHEENGEEKVHQYIGREPSGKPSDAMILDSNKRPHNPYTMSGSLMAQSMIRHNSSASEKFKLLMKTYNKCSGNISNIYMHNSIYLSEKQLSDKHYALSYFMREKLGFPHPVDISTNIEMYFQGCSIALNCQALSVVAATLANEGCCPLTGKVVFKPETVKNVLSMMHSCGMYENSGVFAYKNGVPVKSSISGAIMFVIPGVGGICTYSPKLDSLNSSVRGSNFYSHLNQQFNWHVFNPSKTQKQKKQDQNDRNNSDQVVEACFAAQKGDLQTFYKLYIQLYDFNSSDYDRRTALHIACEYGQLDCIKFLLEKVKVQINVKDRWKNTALDQAKRSKKNQINQEKIKEFEEIIDYLISHKALVGATLDSNTQSFQDLQYSASALKKLQSTENLSNLKNEVFDFKTYESQEFSPKIQYLENLNDNKKLDQYLNDIKFK